MNFSTPGASFPALEVLLTNSISPCYVFSPTMTINSPPNNLAFELPKAVRHLSERDETLRTLIAEAPPFQIDVADAQSPYEVLLESIGYQSISGKPAATIFGRIKALGTDGRPPSPAQMHRIPSPKLRKAGLSGAK